jgi:hypothetical protein
MLDNTEDHHLSDDHSYNVLDDDCALLGRLLDDCLEMEARAPRCTACGCAAARLRARAAGGGAFSAHVRCGGSAARGSGVALSPPRTLRCCAPRKRGAAAHSAARGAWAQRRGVAARAGRVRAAQRPQRPRHGRRAKPPAPLRCALTPPLRARQAGEATLKLLDKIRSLAKSATELNSRGVSDAAEYLHAKLWDGMRARRHASRPRNATAARTRRALRHSAVSAPGGATAGGGCALPLSSRARLVR